MKLRMEKSLKFWVDCSYEDKKHENANHARVELIAEILRDYEPWPRDAIPQYQRSNCLESFSPHAFDTR